jgi:hypothetical protein
MVNHELRHADRFFLQNNKDIKMLDTMLPWGLVATDMRKQAHDIDNQQSDRSNRPSLLHESECMKLSK